MKQNLMTEVMQQMLPYLDNTQLKQLRQVMEHTLFHYEVTSVEVKLEEKQYHLQHSILVLLLMGYCHQ